MKVGERGQVTIPLRIRERYGLNPAVDVEFAEEGGNVVLRPVKTKRRDPWGAAVAVLRGKVKSVDRFVAETRGS